MSELVVTPRLETSLGLIAKHLEEAVVELRLLRIQLESLATTSVDTANAATAIAEVMDADVEDD